MTEQDQVMKHTAGPHSTFTAHPDDVIDYDHSIMAGSPPRVLALLNLVSGSKADLQLWASAPELLEALKPFEAAYHAYVAVMRGETGCGQTEAEQRFIAGEQRDTAREAAWDALASVTFDQLHAVHAAIAKATGEPRP